MHGRYLVPGASVHIKAPNSVVMPPAVKSAHAVDRVAQECSAEVSMWMLHVVDQVSPGVGMHIIRLDEVRRVGAAEAANGKQDGGRQARTSHQVAIAAHRVCVHVAHDAGSQGNYIQALPAVLDQIIGKHLDCDELYACQCETDLHSAN